MFLQLDKNFFRSNIARTLKARNSFVLTALAMYMNSEGVCYPSISTLADETGLDVKTVGKALKELSQTKIDGVPILTIKKTKHLNSPPRNLYTINMDVCYMFQFRTHDKIKTNPDHKEIENKSITNLKIDEDAALLIDLEKQSQIMYKYLGGTS